MTEERFEEIRQWIANYHNVEKENAELKAKLLFNYENIARLTGRSVEEVEKSANEIFLKRSKK